jgi:SAM-dependent methyltransferase
MPSTLSEWAQYILIAAKTPGADGDIWAFTGTDATFKDRITRDPGMIHHGKKRVQQGQRGDQNWCDRIEPRRGSRVEPNQQQCTPAYFRYTIRLLSRFPNFDQPFIGSLRRKAVSFLQLPDGGRALDVGCGLGGSFRYLRAAVGHNGEVVGVEISPDVARAAQRRIEVNQWANVQVVVGDARAVALNGKFDGLMLFGAPDIYASPEALAHLRPYLKDHARVVAFGSKLTKRRFGATFNILVQFLMKLSFASTPKLNLEPWTPLVAYCAEIQVREYVNGSFFLASGSIQPDNH